MSTKRRPTSDSAEYVALFQQEDNAKRAKPSPLSVTMLHDLPTELLEYILIKVVIMEVKGLKLAKRVWNEHTDPVVTRLKTVCPLWNSIMSTSFFRNELHRTLYNTAQVIRLEILYQSPIPPNIFDVTTMKDEIFMLYSPPNQDAVINVHDCNNIAEIKDVISLPGRNPLLISACNLSDCLCVALVGSPSVFRITKDEDHQSTIGLSPWVSDQWMPGATMSVSANESLLFFSEQDKVNPATIAIYNANGSLQHKIMLPREIGHVDGAIQKSNGNLILVVDDGNKCKLTEIDMSMNVVRQYQSSLGEGSCVNFVDIHDRILITDVDMGMELLDSEFNLLDFSRPPKSAGEGTYLHFLRYDSVRNEVICLSEDNADHDLLTIYRFTEGWNEALERM